MRKEVGAVDSMAEDELAERVTELELRFMHQEHVIQELNETVCRQEQTLVNLERHLKLLTEQWRTLTVDGTAQPEQDERPPHY